MTMHFKTVGVWLLAWMAFGCRTADSISDEAEASQVHKVTLAGSSALIPLLTDAANRYMKQHPEIAVEVSGGGSKHGLAAVAGGRVSIGTSDVFADSPELQDHRVAVVGLAVMANRGPFNERLGSLTLTQVRDVFTGRVRDWKDLGGLPQSIVVVNRDKNSGQRAVFAARVLAGSEFVGGSAELGSSGQVQTTLLQQPGAVSYLALSYAHPSLKAFAIDGAPPTPDEIASGAYPIWSYEHLYTRGPAQGPARSFIDFVLSPEVQEGPLVEAGFIAITRMKVGRSQE
jgi:phosphate transport system substrate-binding protein